MIGEEASSESANCKPDNRLLKVEFGGCSCVPVTYRSPGGDDNSILTSLNPLQVIGHNLAESHKQTMTHEGKCSISELCSQLQAG